MNDLERATPVPEGSSKSSLPPRKPNPSSLPISIRTFNCNLISLHIYDDGDLPYGFHFMEQRNQDPNSLRARRNAIWLASSAVAFIAAGTRRRTWYSTPVTSYLKRIAISRKSQHLWAMKLCFLTRREISKCQWISRNISQLTALVMFRSWTMTLPYIYNISLEDQIFTSRFVAEIKEHHDQTAYGHPDKNLETYKPNQHG